MVPPFTLSTRLQSLLNLYKYIQLPYFLSGNNIYCPSLTNRFFQQCIFLIFTVHSDHGPSFTLSTRLQSLVNLYKCFQLRYILSANITYRPSFSKLSLILCMFLVMTVHSDHGTSFYYFYTYTKSS